MNNNETIKDILAEMRDFAEHRDFDSDGNMSTTALRVFADRIEAATEQERADAMQTAFRTKCEVCDRRHGNAAAMREALSDACYAMFNFLKTQSGGYEEMAIALDKAKAALSAPARNCDRFATAGEAMDAFFEEEAPADGETLFAQFVNWLFAPAEGGVR